MFEAGVEYGLLDFQWLGGVEHGLRGFQFLGSVGMGQTTIQFLSCWNWMEIIGFISLLSG